MSIRNDLQEKLSDSMDEAQSIAMLVCDQIVTKEGLQRGGSLKPEVMVLVQKWGNLMDDNELLERVLDELPDRDEESE